MSCWKKISEAPQSAVFKACHKKNPDRLLVLKILRAISLSDYKQAQVTQKIAHLKVLDDPLVITPIGFGVTEGICFITQSYFDGVTLSRLMEAKSPISLMDFFYAGKQAHPGTGDRPRSRDHPWRRQAQQYPRQLQHAGRAADGLHQCRGCAGCQPLHL
ncbi:MAG: hypothetical protein M5R38_09510 [Candidatus Methylomirabilis sp.]|nr:hypothetical protein [Candidatus Methylomirabilis sp.]